MHKKPQESRLEAMSSQHYKKGPEIVGAQTIHQNKIQELY